jgi:DNA-directed RNA polymerase sigma subunit (sigma70/sigma32)
MDSFSGAQDGRTNPYCESESKDVRDPRFDLVESNLARDRWYGPNLGRGEERELIRRAQNDDPQAKDSLHRHFSKTVLDIAGQYYGPTRWLTRDEIAAWGHLGLGEAIKRFNLSRGNGLRAYAEFWIRKFISQATKGKSLDLAAS